MPNLMTGAAVSHALAESREDSQGTVVYALPSAIDRAVDRLVDTDMDEETTRLHAMQVQAQLAIQGLNIANTSARKILALFR